MDEPKLKDEVKKKLKSGWIRSTMMIEAMAVNEETARSALESHVAKMEKEERILVTKKEWGEMRKVENPMKNVPEAYSFIVEMEVLTATYERLFWLVIAYGPTSIEILEPNEMKLKMGEAQSVLNSMSEIIHSFAARGVGGIVVRG
jgi:hypothetical protein